MGKRQRRSSKKKEPFFNFAKLRSSLSAQEKEKLIKFGTYNKDFMWLINVPFAYNLPRYKNLSNEEIFYDVIQNK